MVAKITRQHTKQGSCFISSSSSLKRNNTFRDHLTQHVSLKKIAVLCNVTSGRVADVHRYFRTTCYHHHGRCHSQRRQNLMCNNFFQILTPNSSQNFTKKYSHFIFFLEMRFFMPSLLMFSSGRNM